MVCTVRCIHVAVTRNYADAFSRLRRKTNEPGSRQFRDTDDAEFRDLRMIYIYRIGHWTDRAQFATTIVLNCDWKVFVNRPV